jgi:hypothetical protein
MIKHRVRLEQEALLAPGSLLHPAPGGGWLQ